MPYLRSHDVHVDQLVSSEPGKIHARATPTLVLIERDGRIVNSWRDQLPPTQEPEVVKGGEHCLLTLGLWSEAAIAVRRTRLLLVLAFRVAQHSRCKLKALAAGACVRCTLKRNCCGFDIADIHREK